MISEHAVISETATIGKNVSIGPFSVIGDNVEIGDDTVIESHVVIKGPTKIGQRNHIFQFSSLGECPQDRKYYGEPTTLTIGDDNIIREFVTMSRGTVSGGGKTAIGNHNLLMAYVHIAHDCIVGNHTTFSNNASLAGHVVVEDYASMGGFAGVHQFCRVGQYSYCGGGSIIVKDVLPYVMVSGYPAQTYGLNQVGLKRRGFSEEAILWLKRAYKVIYRQGKTVEQAVEELKVMVADCPEIQPMIDFIQKAERGIIR